MVSPADNPACLSISRTFVVGAGRYGGRAETPGRPSGTQGLMSYFHRQQCWFHRGGSLCTMLSLLARDALGPPRPCSSPAKAIASC
jgi:hypothetical protein